MTFYETIIIRLLLVVWLIVGCLRHRTAPWRFFQLNSKYFNVKKGIYSKLDVDRYIPDRWRLKQFVYNKKTLPDRLPVFVKPEWGQNSHGILCVDSMDVFLNLSPRISKSKTIFIVQEAAEEKREFEIFYVRSSHNREDYSVFSITEVINSGTDAYPVNSVHNPETEYLDRTDTFSEKERHIIWQHVKDIGDFRIARCGIRVNGIKELLRGKFHVIEINLFLPMPLVLCDEHIPLFKKHHFIRTSMLHTAELVKKLPRKERRNSILFRKIIAHYRVKSWQH